MADVQKNLQSLTEEFQKLQTGTSPPVGAKPVNNIPADPSQPTPIQPKLTSNLRKTELETLIDGRQKLEAQQQENKGVQGEFASLDDDANIFKLVGPVLLKQDRNEARMAVNGRLEFIEKEM